MEKQFIELFKEAIDRTDSVALGDRFREYEEWSSLAYLSVISMIDETYDVVIEGNDFKKLNTIGEVIAEIKKRKGE